MDRILIIEDEEHIRENLSWLLEEHGYDVRTAADGQEGLESALADPPQLILCDIRMPRLSGSEVLREVRARESLATVPFVFLTAFSDRDDMRKGMAAGADDYITKPYSNDDVLTAVRARLEHRNRLERRAQERLSELQASIALALPHEMRTPLTSILGFSEILLEEGDELDRDLLKAMIRDMHDSGQRLYDSVMRYDRFIQLELLRTKRGYLTIGAPVIAADAVIRGAAIRVAERHERTDDLQFDLRERSPGIEEQWLEVATAELVDNACKFSETETPVIVQSRLDDGAWMLSVFNRGHGFPAAAAERTGAFLQFHRDDSEHGGLGLGLAMVKIIAALYGGTVEIDEKVGTTTVGVRLPLH